MAAEAEHVCPRLETPVGQPSGVLGGVGFVEVGAGASESPAGVDESAGVGVEGGVAADGGVGEPGGGVAGGFGGLGGVLGEVAGDGGSVMTRRRSAGRARGRRRLTPGDAPPVGLVGVGQGLNRVPSTARRIAYGEDVRSRAVAVRVRRSLVGCESG